MAYRFSQVGIRLQLLSSVSYVSTRLEFLSDLRRKRPNELFLKKVLPRFEKEFAISRHQPFGKTSDYIESIENANQEKMTKIVKLVGILMQTKGYLFWSREIKSKKEEE
jgi:hypothetical protein